MSSFGLMPAQAQELRRAYLGLLTWAANIRSHAPELESQSGALGSWARDAMDHALASLSRQDVPRDIIERSKLAVICTIDELAVTSFKDWNKLQRHYFNDAHRGTGFFEEMESLRANRDNVLHTYPVGLLEIYLFCLAAGYQGGYPDAANGSVNRETLQRNLEAAIAQRAPAVGNLAPELSPRTATQKPRRMLSWVWIVTVVLFIPTLFVIGAYKLLDYRAADIQTEINSYDEHLGTKCH